MNSTPSSMPPPLPPPGTTPTASPGAATEGSSSERNRRVHAARTLLVLLPALALLLAGGVAATGTLRSGPTAAQPATVTPDAAPAALESTASPSVVTTPQSLPPTSTGPVRVEPAPPSAARLVTGPVQRIIDTRQGDGAVSGTGPATQDREGTVFDLPAPGPAVLGLVFSVSVVDATTAGTVTIEGPAGAVEVFTVGGPGTTTTNGFVVVPGSDPTRLVHPVGGDLVVDLVGRFVASGPTGEGRLLAVEPVRLGRLVTATDGRVAEFAVDQRGEAGTSGPQAVLVVITADVGDDGGRVLLGQTPDQPEQMLMWGPPTGPNRQRSGVALVTPGTDGQIALRYDGGSVLDVDLIGSVTGPTAAPAVEGLFVPATSLQVIDRRLGRGTTLIGPVVPAAAAAVVGLRAGPGAGVVPQPVELARDATVASGRTIGTVLPVATGPAGSRGIVVTSATDLDARLQPLGYLLGPRP